MKKPFLSILLLALIITANSQVIKYQSTSYDIEKPGVSGYETIYEISNHIFDFNNNIVTVQKFRGEGSERKAYYVKKFTINGISEEPNYYVLAINNNGVETIYLSKGSGYNIEYDFKTGVHWVFYDLTKFK